MKVLYVVNNCYVKGNGLSASAQRTIRYLREAGLEVKVLSGLDENNPEKPDFILPNWKVPIFDDLIHKQGYSFADIDREVIQQAIDWADIVHLEEPFLLQMEVARMTVKSGKRLTATYHLHPENLFSSIHMRKNPLLNGPTMGLWRDSVFNKCLMIQCPTENVRRRLVKWHFKPELRVITNGMLPHEGLGPDSPICASDSPDGTFRIVTTGRFSVEKDQITLLKAMKHSKYADRIRLVFAGRGPIGDSLKKKAASLVSKGILKYEPDFGFHSLDELEEIYRKSDLYIHCATVEVEGLSCMEAIELGLVPVIATGKLTATAQYALSEKSTYRARNAKELAKRIDYWLDHDALRRAEAKLYLGMGSEYDIHKSIDKLVRMYEDVMKMALER
ncbi:MAG: glycosyltransferase [Spirochaetales bacterium]|nr:glycosyltransferase [Spirochaetales bacterium]